MMTINEFLLLAFGCVAISTLVWIFFCAVADIHDRLKDRRALAEASKEAMYAVTFLLVSGSLFALWVYMAALHKGVLS